MIRVYSCSCVVAAHEKNIRIDPNVSLLTYVYATGNVLGWNWHGERGYIVESCKQFGRPNSCCLHVAVNLPTNARFATILAGILARVFYSALVGPPHIYL